MDPGGAPSMDDTHAGSAGRRGIPPANQQSTDRPAALARPVTALPIDSSARAAPSERDRTILLSLIDRIDATDAGAHNNLGVVLYRHGMVAEAIEQFRRALDADQGLRTARRNLEIAYTESGHYDRQIAALRERLRSDPDDHEARRDLATVYAALRRYDSAVDELQALVARAEPKVDVLVELGLAERALGRARAAAEWLERACALEPDHAVARRHLGTVLHELGRYEAALGSLQHAVDSDPNDPEAHYQLAFALGDLGRHEEANEATRRAIQLSPLIGRPSAHLSLEAAPTRSAFGTGEFERRPSAALAHYNLGLGFRRRGLYLEALREFRLALEEGDDRNLVLPAAASVHLLRRDHAAALELYEQLVEELPGPAKLWNERGVVLHQLGRFDEALASYSRAADLAEAQLFAHNNAGVAYIHLGRNAEAVQAFHRAMQADPAAVLPRANLGLLLLKLRQFEYAM
ncbi:MAG: tetratricopeptide repeat protein, partial [Gemmatimonadota bacterium]|nr:tetratricopeptide repeat protein [Gemmatimonadota bacterium]